MTDDITKGIEDGNNSRNLFSSELGNFNKEFEDAFDHENKKMKKEARTLPPVLQSKTLEIP
jgi:hypothetical protein